MTEKLECKYYATKTASKYVSDATTNIIRGLISTMNDKVEPNTEIANFLNLVDYNLNLKHDSKFNVIEPLEIVLGYKIKKNKRVNQSMYYVPIAKSIEVYLEKFSLSISEAKIVIYLDEITIVNPIGNCH